MLALLGELRVLVGRVDLADVQPVELELACGLVDERLDRDGELVLARPALRPARRRVDDDIEAAPAHRHRR